MQRTSCFEQRKAQTDLWSCPGRVSHLGFFYFHLISLLDVHDFSMLGTRSLQLVIQQVSKEHYNGLADVISHLSLIRLKKLISYLWNRTITSNVPCVWYIGNLTNRLNNRKTLEGDADFYQGAVSTASGHALVFISLGILSSLRDTNKLHADGTFQTVPGLFTQLFTIHVTKYGKVCD